ncbi:MAG: glycosyltransferase family 2 protein [Candidatus Binatia bacterium]
MKPHVSVIIPTYNNALLLPETLNSVLGQSFGGFELIVVDDGSTDDTAAVIERDFPQVKYNYQPNSGPAAARNVGVGLARGDYIAFCDHDDLWRQGHLRALLDGFAAYPGAALLFDNAEYFGVNVSAGKSHLNDIACRALADAAVRPKTLLWDYPVASMSVVMVRKDSFEFVGGLNQQVGALDDLHFYLRLAARYEVRFANYLGCKKRVTGSNLSQLINLKETNVCYLEELWRNHPEVVRSVGRMSFRLRLARKYFKLGRHYKHSGERSLSKEMFLKAYQTTYFNPRYFWHTLRG